MTTSEKILRGIKLNTTIQKTPENSDSAADVMANPSYLRQSSALINEALQKGYDVLQLANGDIVTTGSKIVVTQYSWDMDRGKLVKSKSTTQTRRGRPRRNASILEQEDELEIL
ncbi:DUF2671 domain-containing protein [bacterium]|nr:DUF2671 domain-containing protein [bacterium]